MQSEIDEILNARVSKATTFTEVLQIFKSHPIDQGRLNDIAEEQEMILQSSRSGTKTDDDIE